MKNLFTEIGQLLDAKNCSHYEIIGHNYLKVIVKLVYADANEYFVARYDRNAADGTYTSLKRIGYNVFDDGQYLNELQDFTKLEHKAENEINKIVFDENIR
tara:strand:+ start:934 stop:1236 length:303 start_codon:yes stop_codon:yes gene_type:complete